MDRCRHAATTSGFKPIPYREGNVMKIWGKVIGFLCGFMLSKSIFGALLGLWLGHRFDKGLGLNFDDLARQTEETRQQIFFYTSFAVMGYIAKAKGRVTEHEIQFASAYMDKLGLSADMKRARPRSVSRR